MFADENPRVTSVLEPVKKVLPVRIIEAVVFAPVSTEDITAFVVQSDKTSPT